MKRFVSHRTTRVSLPRDLLWEIDERVGREGRNQFIQDAIVVKLTQLRRVEAFERVVGSIPDGAVPEWDTPESTEAWLRALRAEWNPDRLFRDPSDRWPE
jgi:hypothetical protein